MLLLRRLGAHAGFLAIMLAFVASVGGGTLYILQRLRAEIVADHLEISAMYARVIEEHLTQTLNIVDLALSRAEQHRGSAPAAGMERFLYASLDETPALRSLSLVDAADRIVASSNPANLGLTVAIADYLPPRSDQREHLRIGRPWSGRDFAGGSPATGTALLGFIPMRRQIGEGGSRPALLAALNPDYFVNNYSQKLQPEEGYVEVLRYDGTALFATREGIPDGLQHGGRIFQEELPDHESGSFVDEQPDGTALLTSFRASSRFPLVVVTHVYLERALERWKQERRLLLLVLPPAVLALVLLASMIYLRQRRRAQQMFEEAERRKAEDEQLRAVLEASPDATILVGADGRISFANRVCEGFFGYPSAELLGLDVGALVPPGQRGAHARHRLDFFRQPQPRPMASGLKLKARRKDGGEMPVEISLSPIRRGEQLCVIATVSDIGERIRAEEALLRAKETAEALLGRAKMAERRIVDISEEARERVGQELHDDLGQDLTGIAFLSEVLYQKLRAEGRGEMEEAASITALINAAVSKTRSLAQGLYPVELKEAGLRAMLAQLARNVEQIYKLSCELRFDDDLGIEDFVTQLNLFRIAQEAINNAVKHSRAGAIRLLVEAVADGISFVIADDGIGIGTPDGGAKMGGRGMSIMHYRAALIGATLEIHSRAGVGTRVTVLLRRN